MNYDIKMTPKVPVRNHQCPPSPPCRTGAIDKLIIMPESWNLIFNLIIIYQDDLWQHWNLGGNLWVFILIDTWIHYYILELKYKSQFPVRSKNFLGRLNLKLIYFMIVIDWLQPILKLNKNHPPNPHPPPSLTPTQPPPGEQLFNAWIKSDFDQTFRKVSLSSTKMI